MTYLAQDGLSPGQAARLFAERRKELCGVLSLIEGIAAPLAAAGDARVGRLQPVVAKEVARLQERLATLPGQQWNALTDLERLTRRLASETLAVVGGITVRTMGLHGDACDLADTLLADVASKMALGYKPFTVPSGSEFIDVMSEVIRVRYPGTMVWDLPVVLHEFGHFLVDRLPRSSRPSVSAIIERERADRPYLGYFAEELWADTFATYVAGPAYAFSALLRFDAVMAFDDDKPSHPSPMKRAAAIRFTLACSQAAWQRKDQAAGSLDLPIALAEELWRDRLEASGVFPEPHAEDRMYAEGIAGEYVGILDRDWVVVRYDDARCAATIRSGFDEGRPELPQRAGLVDVLNGGWWARRTAEAELRDVRVIANEMERMCRRVAANG